MNGSSAKILGALALLLAGLNSAALIFLFWQRGLAPIPSPTPAAIRQSTTASEITAPTAVVSSGSAEVSELKQSISDLSSRIEALENQSPAPAARTSAPAAVKELSLFMGSGSTTSRDWTMIDSAAVTIDTAQYGKIKSVRFEAAASILSGEGYVRLALQDGTAVFYDSQLTFNQSAAQWQTSGIIRLVPGKHTYAVQLRSSNNERVNLDGARLKIMVQ